MKITFDFEKPLAELQQQIDKVSQIEDKNKLDMSATLTELQNKLEDAKKEIYGNLNGWQKVQISRHPERPYTLQYIELMCDDFIEMHGDRTVGDDKAIVGGIDTPGAYPGLEAEERGQGEAIARNLLEMSVLKVPIVCVIIGEGASGGALGIGIGDRVLMLDNSWYSVISPENCSTILWKTWENKERAAEVLKLTSTEMLKNKLIDGVVKEPLGGAHQDPVAMANILKKQLIKELKNLKEKSAEQLVTERIDKFCAMGVVIEG
ncbi:MAG: acetyl-CoA carboxylase carboxyl transferase subunit alpha [Sphingobacteriales bacterium]|nr:MAG: acetyl-CoA carboxylase carboxyl transferase subunit alpha [Sphingobacteriales bacterium]